MRQWALARLENGKGARRKGRWLLMEHGHSIVIWGVRALKVNVICLEDLQQLGPRSLLCSPPSPQSCL